MEKCTGHKRRIKGDDFAREADGNPTASIVTRRGRNRPTVVDGPRSQAIAADANHDSEAFLLTKDRAFESPHVSPRLRRLGAQPWVYGIDKIGGLNGVADLLDGYSGFPGSSVPEPIHVYPVKTLHDFCYVNAPSLHMLLVRVDMLKLLDFKYLVLIPGRQNLRFGNSGPAAI